MASNTFWMACGLAVGTQDGSLGVTLGLEDGGLPLPFRG
jgi:hypothetical protein